MKTIILYGRRNTGLVALSFLVSLGYTVKVITDDENIIWLANVLHCEIIDFGSLREFDLLLCVHGNKILPKEILDKGPMVNIHPCLFKYKGANPIKRYIENSDVLGSVESHWMTEKVDDGELIWQEFFGTSICKTHADYYNSCVDKYMKVIDRTLKIVL